MNVNITGPRILAEFSFFGLCDVTIPQTTLTSLLVLAAVTILCWRLGRNLRKRPGRMQAVTERAVLAVYKLVDDTMGKHNERFAPYIGALFCSSVLGSLASLTGFVLTRGVLCALRRPLPRSVEEVCRNARRVAVLEGIVDSTNVGAIFRSAAALNMDAVLVTPSCCDPLCRRAVRVSMGTVFQVPWAQIGTCPADWPENGIAQLHSLGFKTAAMALSDRSVSIDDSALSAEPKLAIVLGTEGDGLAHSTIAACDYTVKIPMSHGVDSLNVAAASAVAFWQLGNR